MIRLILSLIDPTEGNILLSEGNLVKEINRNYRETYFLLFLKGIPWFSGSIRDNLKYGNPYASDDEIKAALKNACALDFVNELEDGLDTMIGEKRSWYFWRTSSKNCYC